MLPGSSFDFNNNQNNNNNLNNNTNQNMMNNNTIMNNNVNQNINNQGLNAVQNNTNNATTSVNGTDFKYENHDTGKTQEQVNSENGQLMALIAYLGPLALIPFLQEKKNTFVIFHAKQGMNLFIIEAILGIVLEVSKFMLINIFFWLTSIIDFVFGIIVVGFSLIGIYYVLEKKMEKIPIIGSINIIK